jgi:hypothetical protein
MTSLDIEKSLKRSQRRPGHYTWLARIPFALFAVGGMCGIVAFKFYGIDQKLVTAGAIALILVYCALVWSVPVLRIREDQLGDNCYYLGFLYTLISLSWALYKFTMSSSATDSTAVSDIIANFGVALGSTIAGILLRVIINQARKDVLETERDARMMLTETMVNMRVQLDDAVIALRSFCAQAQQITADAIRDNAERANTALEQSVTKIGETSSGVLIRIEEAFEEFSTNTKKLNQVAAGTVKALETLIDRLEQMEPPSDLISRRLDSVMSSAEKAGALLRERLEADEKAISEAAQRMKDMEERLRQASGWISSAGSGLGGVSEAAVRASRAAEEASQKLIALTATMSQSLVQQERLVSETRISSAGLAGTLLEEQKRLAEQARASLDALFGALKAHNDAMAEELARTRRMTGDTGRAMADLADTVTDRVRELRGVRPLGDAAE